MQKAATGSPVCDCMMVLLELCCLMLLPKPGLHVPPRTVGAVLSANRGPYAAPMASPGSRLTDRCCSSPTKHISLTACSECRVGQNVWPIDASCRIWQTSQLCHPQHMCIPVQGPDSMGAPLVQVANDAANDPRIKSSANANAFATPNDRRKSAVLNADGSEAAEQADQAQSDKPPQVISTGPRSCALHSQSGSVRYFAGPQLVALRQNPSLAMLEFTPASRLDWLRNSCPPWP